MSLPRKTVAILGLGLIGGSLARALRKADFCEHLIGWGYRDVSLRRGIELGVIDEFTLDLEAAMDRADILVICTPTLTASDVLETILPRLQANGPVVTDVASVKGSILEAAIRISGALPSRFVLGHPIAGSERSGVEASNADLFVDHRVILTPGEGNDPEAVELMRQMWRSTGADILEMDVQTHDRVLAATSHLPHVLAYALVDALASSADSTEIFRCAAGGFRDFTRIASSDPIMWRDIALANRQALLGALDEFGGQLSQLRSAIDRADGEQLEAVFQRAKTARDEFAATLPEPSKKA